MPVQQVVNGPAAEVKTGRMRAQAFGMFVIGMAMWVGVPGFWLYVGSQIKAASNSLSLALVVMAIGALATVVGLVKLLGTLNRRWLEEYEQLNERTPHRSPLEPVLVVSAFLALAVFGIWFTFFAGGGGPTIGSK
jgi:hypothetical protein